MLLDVFVFIRLMNEYLCFCFFFSSRRRHTRLQGDWSSDVCSSDLGPERLDPAKIGNLTLTNRDGAPIPVSQIGRIEMRSEDPILRRRDRIPTITVQSDIDESLQPPQVSGEIEAALKPIPL